MQQAGLQGQWYRHNDSKSRTQLELFKKVIEGLSDWHCASHFNVEVIAKNLAFQVSRRFLRCRYAAGPFWSTHVHAAALPTHPAGRDASRWSILSWPPKIRILWSWIRNQQHLKTGCIVVSINVTQCIDVMEVRLGLYSGVDLDLEKFNLEVEHCGWAACSGGADSLEARTHLGKAGTESSANSAVGVGYRASNEKKGEKSYEIVDIWHLQAISLCWIPGFPAGSTRRLSKHQRWWQGGLRHFKLGQASLECKDLFSE